MSKASMLRSCFHKVPGLLRNQNFTQSLHFFELPKLSPLYLKQKNKETSRFFAAPTNAVSESKNTRPSFEGRVELTSHNSRLDAFLSEKIPKASRAKVQACIKAGQVFVNGKVQIKPSTMVKEGDSVECVLLAPPPLEASPEAIPLDIVFEDDFLLVVNKPPHLVVHPSPGHYSGTLVNGLLHHCKLPSMEISTLGKREEEDEEEENEDEDSGDLLELSSGNLSGPSPVIRPGIVHRLDKGTSGLLVVAKDEFSHAALCEQFKERSVERKYLSLLCGVPEEMEGRIQTWIGRDSRERKRMAVVGPNGGGRKSASRFKVVQVLARGAACLTEWKLETGRTHQIRVHAKYMGNPVLGDEMYGGLNRGFLDAIKVARKEKFEMKEFISYLSRPCLHAETLGFVHPEGTGKLHFSVGPPDDFLRVLEFLRS